MIDAIIMSDLHLGSNSSNVAVIDALLDDLPLTSRLILNGDVLQGTETRLKKNHWAVLSKLRKLSDHLELVWVKGNHDGDAGPVAHLIGAAYVDSYVFETGDMLCRCEHGDSFDDFVTSFPLLTEVADFAHRLVQRFSVRLARRLKLSSKVFLRAVGVMRGRALLRARKLGVGIICVGHSHHAELVWGPVSYANSGSFAERECHYLKVKQGEVELCKM